MRRSASPTWRLPGRAFGPATSTPRLARPPLQFSISRSRSSPLTLRTLKLSFLHSLLDGRAETTGHITPQSPPSPPPRGTGHPPPLTPIPERSSRPRYG